MNTIQDIAVTAHFADGFVARFRIGSGKGRTRLTAAQIQEAAERTARSHWQVRYAPRTRSAFDVFAYPTPLIKAIDVVGATKPKPARRTPKPVCCPNCQHSFALAA